MSTPQIIYTNGFSESNQITPFMSLSSSQEISVGVHELKQNKEHDIWSGFMGYSSAESKRTSEEKKEGENGCYSIKLVLIHIFRMHSNPVCPAK